MRDIINVIRDSAAAQSRSVVLPEATDQRILRAALEVKSAGIAEPVLLGDLQEIQASADNLKLSLDGIAQYDTGRLAQSASLQTYLRSCKRYSDLSDTELAAALQDPLTQACCLLATDQVDACVAGAVNTTTRVIQHGLRIIGTDEQSPLLSSFYLMVFDRPPAEGLEFALYADCAINVNPDCDQLARIATATAESMQKLFELEPMVALLSFSTAGSASHPDADKVAFAAQRMRTEFPASRSGKT